MSIHSTARITSSNGLLFVFIFHFLIPPEKKPRTQTESIKWPNASQLAQLLCRIERNLAKHVGPEEFVQCNANLLKNPNREDFTPKAPGAGPGPTGGTTLDGKKTCNLESYLEWSARLRLLVANEILKVRMNEIQLMLQHTSNPHYSPRALPNPHFDALNFKMTKPTN